MKPGRQPVSPLTLEDEGIWFVVCCMFRPRIEDAEQVLGRAIDSDRRDAHLMYTAQTIAVRGPAAIELFGIACRGWDET